MRTSPFLILVLALCLFFPAHGGRAAQAVPTAGKTTATSVQKSGTAKKTATRQKTASKRKTTKATPKSTKKQTLKKGKKAATVRKSSARKRSRESRNVVATEETLAPLAVVRGSLPTPLPARQAAVSFDRVLHACLFRGNQWLLPHTVESDAAGTLALLRPTFVTGALRLEAGTLPSRATAESWNALRSRVLKSNVAASFDLLFDLRRFKTPEEVARHMRAAGALLPAEAWTFTGVDDVARSKPDIWAAAMKEADLQKRKKGGYVQTPSLAADLDYIVVPYKAGGKDLSRRMAALGKGEIPARRVRPVPLLVVADSDDTPPGEGFARGKTPAQRRLMVKEAAKMQNAKISFAYPVFGPMATMDRSYNALRDEFMYDTVRRSMRTSIVRRTP